MAQEIFLKTPEAVLDFSFDWSQWLDSANNEIINTSSWTVPSGITQYGGATKTNSSTTVWLTGGTAGKSYILKNIVTTTNDSASSRTDSRTFKVKVGDR